MAQLLIVVRQLDERKFKGNENGQACDVSVVDVLLTDGINQYLASAFDKVALRLIKEPLKPGAWVSADLSFNVRTWKNEAGKENQSQAVRLQNIVAL